MLKNIMRTNLSRVENVNGDIFHVLRSDDGCYEGFGEVYCTWIYPKSIKAWKCHAKMTLNLVVPVGLVQFVFHEVAKNNEKLFRVEEVGKEKYARLTVPPGIWFGFRGLGDSASLVLNVANIMHHPDEAQRMEVDDIVYNW